MSIQKLDDDFFDDEMIFNNPVLQEKPISIENALTFGETNRFYYVIESDKVEEFMNLNYEQKLQ